MESTDRPLYLFGRSPSTKVRKLACIATTFLALLTCRDSPASDRIGFETATDRFGNDYASAVVSTPVECQKLCGGDLKCQAYTTQIAPAGQSRMCWLKSAPGRPISNDCCISGARNGTLDLTVLVANMKGISSYPERGGNGTIDWKTRYARLGMSIRSSGSAPDIIAITEFNGWESCILSAGAGDYDAADILLNVLASYVDGSYRIAYMTGRISGYGGINRTRCTQYQGDLLIYNARRLKNQTQPTPSSTLPHDNTIAGTQLRLSLPPCNRKSSLMPIESLLDGPAQANNCGRQTPSGVAWALNYNNVPDSPRVIATAGRFSFQHDDRASFDVVVTHPIWGDEDGEKDQIAQFIVDVTTPPRRVSAPAIPTLVLGDFNRLSDTHWAPPGFKLDFNASPDGDPMGVMSGFVPASGIPRAAPAFAGGLVLPLGHQKCGADAVDLAFSDHCALRANYVDTQALQGSSPHPTPDPRQCQKRCKDSMAACLAHAPSFPDRTACREEAATCGAAC